MKMNIKKLLVLGMLSFTLTGSIVTTSEVAQAKIIDASDPDGSIARAEKAAEKKRNALAKKAIVLKKNDWKNIKVYKTINAKIKKGKSFAIKSKSLKCIDKFSNYYDTGHVFSYKKYYVTIFYFGDVKLNRGEFSKYNLNNLKEHEKEEKFTKKKIIPAVYAKYWELLEQGKAVKPMFWGNNGYKDIDISNYPIIARCIQNGERPEFNELSEVSQVHILTYFLRRYEFVDWNKKGIAKNSFCKWETDIERLNCYFDTVVNNKNFNLNCQTIYDYNELLTKQLGLFSENRMNSSHGWGTLTCKDFNGNNRFMECDNAGFYIAGAENDFATDDKTGESTHAQEDMLAYLNSELEYLGY